MPLSLRRPERRPSPRWGERGIVYEFYLIIAAICILAAISIPAFRQGWRHGLAVLIGAPLLLAAAGAVVGTLVYGLDRLPRLRAAFETAVSFVWYSLLCFILLALASMALLHVPASTTPAMEDGAIMLSGVLALVVGALIASERVRGLKYAFFTVLILALTFSLLMSAAVLVVALAFPAGANTPMILTFAAALSAGASVLLIRGQRPLLEPREKIGGA